MFNDEKNISDFRCVVIIAYTRKLIMEIIAIR